MPLNKKEQYAGTVISFFAILLLSTYITMPALGFDDEVLLLAAVSVLIVVIACLCIFIFRAYSKKNKAQEIDYLNIGTQRYILGLFMIFYGVPKLFGNFFDYQLSALDTKLVDVSEFELAWYYFGKNRWQELFAGIMEFIPGLLLLNRRTYYTAALILLPVTAQVFILNLFFKIGGVTFHAASILLACNLYIIFSQKEKIVQFFRSLDFSAHHYDLSSKTRTMIKVGRWGGIVLAVFIIFIGVRPVLFKSAYQRKYEKLVGVYTLENMKKNNATYLPSNDSCYYKDLYIEKQSRWNMLRRFNNKTDACILNLNSANDSIEVCINQGGTGDGPDIIDTLTALKGIYRSDNNVLTITGVQLNDTLQLTYRKQNIAPKQWFW